MQRKSFSIKNLTEFLIVYGEGLYSPSDYTSLYVALNKHGKYNTLDVIEDEKGIKAVSRYNIISPQLAFVIDVVIRPDAKNTGMLRELVRIGKEKFPDLTHISFDRGKDYPERKRQVIKIKELLPRR